MTASPEDVLRAFVEDVWNAHDVARFDGIVHPDVRFHPPLGPAKDRDAWRAHVTAFMAAFPDVRFTLEAVLTEGDEVTGRMRMEGTHRGPLGPHAPTGKRFSVQGRPWCRVKDGRIVAFWSLFDELGMLGQLGLASVAERAFGGAVDEEKANNR